MVELDGHTLASTTVTPDSGKSRERMLKCVVYNGRMHKTPLQSAHHIYGENANGESERPLRQLLKQAVQVHHSTKQSKFMSAAAAQGGAQHRCLDSFPVSGLLTLPFTLSRLQTVCSRLLHCLGPASLGKQGLVRFLYPEGAGGETDVPGTPTCAPEKGSSTQSII